MPTITSGSPTPVDGRRLRGDATRQLVLAEAVQMASEKGLSDMSIAQLADAVHLSKSGIATLFGSKEALQLAVVEYARTVFVAEVITPCSEVPDGAEKLRAIGASWLRYSRNRVFRGGCFFLAAAAEFDSRPGAVKQRVAQCLGEWDDYLARCASRAAAAGDLRQDIDSRQFAFDMYALFVAVNTRSMLHDDDDAYDMAERSLRRLLVDAGAAKKR